MQRQHLVRHESRIDGLHAPDGANEETRGNQQDHRHCHFDGDEHGTEPLLRSAAGTGAFAKRVEPGAPARTDGREETESHRRERREHGGEGHHAQIHAGLRADRQRRRHETGEERHAGGGHGKTGGAAEERQDDALGDQLPHQSLPAGAERGADRQLALARGRARQQQVGEIGGGEQQQAQARAAEGEKHQAESRGHVVPHAEVADAGLLVGVRILAREALGDDHELGARLLERHSRSETCHAVDVVVRPVGVVLVPERQHRPQLAVPGGKVEGRRHDADDGVGNAVETHRSPEHRRVARELRLPQPMADDRCAAIVLAPIEDASERRLHTEQRKHFGRDRRRLETPRLTDAHEVDRARREGSHRLE